MIVARLVCPNCKCPLLPPSGQSTGMSCPRCNTWLDIDPACSGSCLACHKLHQITSTACVEPAQQASHTSNSTASPSASEAKSMPGARDVRSCSFQISSLPSTPVSGSNSCCNSPDYHSEKSRPNVVQSDGWAGAPHQDTSPVKTWKAVVGKLFHVR